MKTIVSSLLPFCMILCNWLTAQENLTQSKDDYDRRKKFEIGLKAGDNGSDIFDTKGENFTSNPVVGFAGGAFLSIPLGRFMGIQPEVLFSQKGFKATWNELGNGYSYTQISNYLDVPILFQIKPSPFLTILVGPDYSYLTHTKFTFSNSFITSTQQSDIENQNIRKNILAGELGLDFNIKYFVISARIAMDLQDNNGNGTSTSIRYANAWGQLTLGFKL